MKSHAVVFERLSRNGAVALTAGYPPRRFAEASKGGFDWKRFSGPRSDS